MRMGRSAKIFVHGIPTTQGSKKVITHRHTGKPIMIESSSRALKTWREAILKAAAELSFYIDEGPIEVILSFILPRPKSASAKRTPFELAAKRPDLSKLLRAAEDALTGVWYRDDSQIVSAVISKRVALPSERPGVKVYVSVCNGQ